MATARRLYLYVISGVGLSMAAVGGAMMLRTILNKAGVGTPGANSSFTAASDRDTLALSIALVAVGLLLWLVHWALAIRMTEGDSEAAIAERSSIVRSVYMALVLAVSFVGALLFLSDLVSNTIGDVVSKVPYPGGLSSGLDASWSLAIGVVLGVIWIYHASVRRADVRRETLTGAAAWVSRLYLYGAVWVALAQLLGQLSTFIYAVVGSGLRSNPNSSVDYIAPFGPGVYTTHLEVVTIVAAAIWGAAAVLHWLYSNRLRDDPGARGELERRSRIRLAFLGLLVISVATNVASGAVSSLVQLLAWVLRPNTGSAVGASDTMPLWYLVGAPLVATLPYVAAWLWARHRALTEEPAGPVGVSAGRIIGYGVALVGIVLLAAGAAQILTTLFSHLASSAADSYPDAWKLQVSTGTALLVVGFLLWIWPWTHAGNRRDVYGTTETRSSSRSYYLYSINGGALVVFAASAAFILYKVLRVVLGQPETDLGLQLSPYFALVLVAIALVWFHTRYLLRDDGFDGRPARQHAGPGPVPYGTEQPGGPTGWQPPATPPPATPPPATPSAATPSAATPSAEQAPEGLSPSNPGAGEDRTEG